MTDTVRYWVIDSFANAPYTGNPAGVVLDADSLDEVQMQVIAREINAAETAFVSRLSDLHRPALLRWFTPTCEVKFCGHATLAAAHALYDSGAVAIKHDSSQPTVQFETSAGELSLRAEPMPEPDVGPLWWLEMPEPSLTPDNTNPMRTTELLGITLDDLEPGVPIMRTRDDDLIIMIKSWTTLVHLRPHFHELKAWCEQHKIRGISVATRNTLDNTTDVHSRFFAPAFGIDEDPATGSVHGPLATLLVINDRIPMIAGKAALNCMQGQPGGRTGLVRALVEQSDQGYRVMIGGRCYKTLFGELTVPARGDPTLAGIPQNAGKAV